MPICFGISFTKTPMNQARALVHIYMDGSVSVSTGAIEMGQGVNTKIIQVAAQTLGISTDKIKIHSTNTSRIANTSPSAASATADLNGRATQIACNNLIERLKIAAAEILKVENAQDISFKQGYVHVNDEQTEWTWAKIINEAYLKRVSLSEHAHYATPSVHFDWTVGKGHPFAYHVYGTAVITATVDCLRGTYVIDAVKVMHDVGKSMNMDIDLGQLEGGIVQGIGWMTMEEVVFDAQGKLRSNALSTYKIPDIYSVPKIIDIQFLEKTEDNLAIFNSKAVGEPPLMYGIGAYFAIKNAMADFNAPENDEIFSAPITPEKVLMGLYEKQTVLDTVE